MDTWTALMLSRQKTCELRRDAARHRLAKLAAPCPTEPGQRQDRHLHEPAY